MPRPAVAVVIPLFNSAATVGETVQSVRDQTLDPALLEVILVDDGSSDDGLAVALDTLSGSAIQPTAVRHETNRGASAARNSGWRAARAPWLQFLDSDDLLEPGKCELQLQVAQASEPRTAAIYSSWGRLTRRADGRWTKSPAVEEPRIGDDAVLDVLRPDNFLATGSYLLRRSVVARVGGYDETFRLIQDVALLLSIALDGARFVHAPSSGPVSWYRQRAGSLSRSNQSRFILECLMNARRAELAWTAGGRLTPERTRLLAQVHFMAARHQAEHDPEAFEETVRRLAELAPAFVPAGPVGLRRLSRLVGYPAAERLAVRYRRARRLLHR